MLYELRIYEIAPNRMKPAVDRIAQHALHYLNKHGIRPVMYWEPVIGTSNQLIYLIEWASLAEREARWDAYVNDPGWVAARAESEKDGPILVRSTNMILREVPSIGAAMRAMSQPEGNPAGLVIPAFDR